MREAWIQSLGWKSPLEEGMATHSSILAWISSQTEKPGGLQPMGLQRVGHNWVTKHSTAPLAWKSFTSLSWLCILYVQKVLYSLQSIFVCVVFLLILICVYNLLWKRLFNKECLLGKWSYQALEGDISGTQSCFCHWYASKWGPVHLTSLGLNPLVYNMEIMILHFRVTMIIWALVHWNTLKIVIGMKNSYRHSNF